MKAALIVEPGVDVAEEVGGGHRRGSGIDFEDDLPERRREHDTRKRILWASGESKKGQEAEN